MKRPLLGGIALLLLGCGEFEQAVPYTDGAYQGKRDQRVWDTELAQHDRALWKRMIDERTRHQSEYGRTQD